LPGFPRAISAKPKTLIGSGPQKRKRWKDPDGTIFEWDYQHGTVEKYDKRGKHLGEYDQNGRKLKGPEPNQRIKP
jgi:hypothetical protein